MPIVPHCLFFAKEGRNDWNPTLPEDGGKASARFISTLEGYPVVLCLLASLLLGGGTLARLAVPLMIAPGTAGGDLRMWRMIASLSVFAVTSLPAAFIIRVLSGERRWAYAVIAMEVILTAATWAATDSDHARMIRNPHPAEDVHENQFTKEMQPGNHISKPAVSVSLLYDAGNNAPALLQADRTIRNGPHQNLHHNTP